MNLEEALQLFEEIVELCYECENPRLIEVAESIYPEVQKANDVAQVISSCAELQVAINEEDFLDSEEEYAADIQEKIEMMSE